MARSRPRPALCPTRWQRHSRRATPAVSSAGSTQTTAQAGPSRGRRPSLSQAPRGSRSWSHCSCSGSLPRTPPTAATRWRTRSAGATRAAERSLLRRPTTTIWCCGSSSRRGRRAACATRTAGRRCRLRASTVARAASGCSRSITRQRRRESARRRWRRSRRRRRTCAVLRFRLLRRWAAQPRSASWRRGCSTRGTTSPRSTCTTCSGSTTSRRARAVWRLVSAPSSCPCES
mmetsp:Transcript_3010/g.9513  ORF Transcript_3010/g.9513 Transcript_3010/m.9513 type:complete len:232 (+) Transcript_3010:46-741(+)